MFILQEPSDLSRKILYVFASLLKFVTHSGVGLSEEKLTHTFNVKKYICVKYSRA